MSISNEFTPAQIQDLIEGKTVSFTRTDKDNSALPNKNEQKASHNPDAEPAKAFSPRAHVKVEAQARVSAPNVRSAEGKVVSKAEDRISGPSATAFDNVDHARIKAEAEVKAQEEAAKELKRVASPEQLLNQLNGLRRIVDKQSKEIAALKKASK